MPEDPRSSGGDSVELRKLLAALGESDNPFNLHGLVPQLEEIAEGWSKAQHRSKSYRKRLIQYRDALAKCRRLYKEVEPVLPDVRLAGYLKANPRASVSGVRAALYDEKDVNLEEVAEAAEYNINAYLAPNDYRKSLERKYVIEPFLLFLEANDIKPTRKLPLFGMACALFDWLGIDADRLDESSFRTIVSDFNRSRR